jgi:hypothetical protein
VFASSRLGGTVLAADDGGPLPAADPTKDDVMDFKLELVPIPV